MMILFTLFFARFLSFALFWEAHSIEPASLFWVTPLLTWALWAQLSPLLSKTSQLSTLLSKSARLSTFLSAQKIRYTLKKALKLRQNLPLVVWAKLRYDFGNFSAIPQTSACAFYFSSYMFTSMQWSSEEEMGVPWSLYAAHTLSTWGDNMWWFAGRHLDIKKLDTLFVHLHSML